MAQSQLHGLLVVDKPKGVTSRDVVNIVQRQLPRRTRIGHAGTLDPLATGVLVLCVGKATRLTEYIQRMEKEYVTTIILGATSTTDDADGEISSHAVAQPPDKSQIESALALFSGEIQQVPPAYSAVKAAGRRAYKLARQGHCVELRPRTVRVDSIRLEEFNYPQLTVRICCGKGTYIRSIARDLGEHLGGGGYVQTLRRTRIGKFTGNDALPLDRCDGMLIDRLLPLQNAVANLARIDVNADERDRLQHGQAIRLRPSAQPQSETDVAMFFDGNFFAVGKADTRSRTLLPIKVLG